MDPSPNSENHNAAGLDATAPFRCKICGEPLTLYSDGICNGCREKRRGSAGISRSSGELVANRYRLLRLLDKGGMGEVWLAVEEMTWRENLSTAPPPEAFIAHRNSAPALKALLKQLEIATEELQSRSPGLLYAIKFTKRRHVEGWALDRFQQERRQLARLRHPNIAQVKDATAEDSGEPLLVMEYVRGETITAYCDRRSLSVPRRLQLFLDICRGVRHAHERGMTHRDLKPSNILVTDATGEPIPKLIDFGLAVDADSQRREWLAGQNTTAFAGTLAYASPEQLRGESETDVNSDVYALGVILFELLVGRTPISPADIGTMLDRGPENAAAQLAVQGRPTLTECFEQTTYFGKSRLARRRNCSLRKLANFLRKDSDLHVIVAKSLSRDTQSRMGSVEELMRHIQRYLDGEICELKPLTWHYQTTHFIKRHSQAVMIVLMIAATLLAATGWSIWSAHQTNLARKDTDTARKRAGALVRESSNADLAAAALHLSRGAWQSGVAQLGRSLRHDPSNADARKALWLSLLYMERDGGALPIREERAAKIQSPDGQFSFDTSESKLQIRAQNSGATGKSIAHTEAITRFLLSKQGTRVAIAGDTTIQVWDWMTRTPLGPPIRTRQNTELQEISPSGSLLLTSEPAEIEGTPATELKVINALTGGERFSSQYLSPIERFIFNSDETRLLVEAALSPVDLINLNSQEIWILNEKQNDHVVHASYMPLGRIHPDGNVVATAGWGHGIWLWDVQSNDRGGRRVDLPEFISHVDFTRDGSRIIAAGSESLFILDGKSGSILARARNLAGVTHLVGSPNGLLFAIADNDGNARLWDGRYCDPITPPLRHDAQISQLEFSSDGAELIATLADGLRTVWSTRNGCLLPLPIEKYPGGKEGLKKSNSRLDQSDWIAFDWSTQRYWGLHNGMPALLIPTFFKDEFKATFNYKSPEGLRLGGDGGFFEYNTNEVPPSDTWELLTGFSCGALLDPKSGHLQQLSRSEQTELWKTIEPRLADYPEWRFAAALTFPRSMNSPASPRSSVTLAETAENLLPALGFRFPGFQGRVRGLLRHWAFHPSLALADWRAHASHHTIPSFEDMAAFKSVLTLFPFESPDTASRYRQFSEMDILRIDESPDDYQIARSADLSTVRGTLEKAKALLNLQRREEVASLLQRISSGTDITEEDAIALAQVAASLPRLDLAYLGLQNVVSRFPNNHTLQELWARILIAMDQPGSAVERLAQRASTAQGSTDSFHAICSMALWRSGSRPKAQAAARSIRDKDALIANEVWWRSEKELLSAIYASMKAESGKSE